MKMRVVAVLAVVVAAVGGCSSGPESLGDPGLDAGREVFGRLCSSCHGGSGTGGSAPALTSVLETFPDCATHMQWVTIGSERWKDEVGPTYGATDKEITAIMPSFVAVLTPEEISQVAAFERFRFGGAEMVATLEDCGI